MDLLLLMLFESDLGVIIIDGNFMSCDALNSNVFQAPVAFKFGFETLSPDDAASLRMVKTIIHNFSSIRADSRVPCAYTTGNKVLSCAWVNK